MALTGEQLLALKPPDGWKWDPRPGLRTSGRIVRDEAHGWNYAGIADKFQTLAKWSKKHEIGLKPEVATYRVVSSNYTEFCVTSAFKAWANKPDLYEATFAEWTCLCGRTVFKPGEVYCSECGPVRCRSCNTTGSRLHAVPRRGAGYNELRCSTCTTKCTTKGCHSRTVTGGAVDKCNKCAPTFVCAVCGGQFEKKGSTETDKFPTMTPGEPARICPTCVERFTCQDCKQLIPDQKLTVLEGKRICAMCYDKKDEAERIKHETFAPDMLPAGGSMLIPSLPSRPFRTVSVETEVDGDGPYLARTLYRCGLVPLSKVANYQAHPELDSEYLAFLKHDGSVSGGELISYLLNLDNPVHAESFLEVLRKLESLHKMKKIQFNSNCGGHIHIDAHNYGYANVWRLLTGFGYIEDTVFRIAGAGCSYGHRTLDPRAQQLNSGVGYTNPTTKGPYGSKSIVGRTIRQMHRMSALNFQPFLHAIGNCECGAWAYEDSLRCKCNLGKATIEWRVFNSTHNPRILHGWIALVQALHAWADESQDPNEDWEKEYPALAWTKTRFDKTTAQHQSAAKARLEWIHTHLPFTEVERDSLCYVIQESDMGPILGTDYIQGLKSLPNVADYEKPKSARNPSRRKRDIKIAPPEPGKEGPYRGREGRISRDTLRSPFAQPRRVSRADILEQARWDLSAVAASPSAGAPASPSYVDDDYPPDR